MYLHQLPGSGGQLHAPGHGGFRAKGLAVQEIAPAADGLPEQQTDAGQVQKGQDLELPHAGIDQHAEHRANDGARLPRALDGVLRLVARLVLEPFHSQIGDEQKRDKVECVFY